MLVRRIAREDHRLSVREHCVGRHLAALSDLKSDTSRVVRLAVVDLPDLQHRSELEARKHGASVDHWAGHHRPPGEWRGRHDATRRAQRIPCSPPCDAPRAPSVSDPKSTSLRGGLYSYLRLFETHERQSLDSMDPQILEEKPTDGCVLPWVRFRVDGPPRRDRLSR